KDPEGMDRRPGHAGRALQPGEHHRSSVRRPAGAASGDADRHAPPPVCERHGRPHWEPHQVFGHAHRLRAAAAVLRAAHGGGARGTAGNAGAGNCGAAEARHHLERIRTTGTHAMPTLTLAQASTIVDAALEKGRETKCAPLTVAVLDAGGHLVAFKREDRSGLLRFDIAFGKAWGALGMGFGSRTLAARAAKTPQFFTMLAAASEGRMVTNPGGV